MYAQPPPNVYVTPAYTTAGFVVYWDNPYAIASNANLNIAGCHVYRSLGSPNRGFERLTAAPVQGVSYSDLPVAVLATEVPLSVSRSVNSATVIVPHVPIVGTDLAPTAAKSAVSVTVDGVEAKILQVIGDTGDVVLDLRQLWNPETRSVDVPPEITEDSEILVTYSYLSNKILTLEAVVHRTPVYYKVVPTLADGTETPLDRVIEATYLNTDSLAWYWREAVRRNRWLLYQGGERVRLFLRKHMGTKCTYRTERVVEEVLQSHPKSCPRCFGTGFLGGYYGPHHILIAPPEEEHRIDFGPQGFFDGFTQTTWTSPSPIVSQRDLIVKMNGERFLVGPVAHVTCPGGILQQEFTIQRLDPSDPLYAFPLGGTDTEEDHTLWPVLTNKPMEPNDQERGSTEVFVETTYGPEGVYPPELTRRKS